VRIEVRIVRPSLGITKSRTLFNIFANGVELGGSFFKKEAVYFLMGIIRYRHYETSPLTALGLSQAMMRKFSEATKKSYTRDYFYVDA
jgi:hypothetical protein